MSCLNLPTGGHGHVICMPTTGFTHETSNLVSCQPSHGKASQLYHGANMFVIHLVIVVRPVSSGTLTSFTSDTTLMCYGKQKCCLFHANNTVDF